jgi:undecaprenyl diphosphate synthase
MATGAGPRPAACRASPGTGAAGELGNSYLTLFGFSSENWKRPADEIDDLMSLLRHYLRGEVAELHRNNVRVRVIGDRERLAPDIVTLIDNTEKLTAENTGLKLSVALSYGGRAEIAGAARRIAEAALAGRLDLGEIEEAVFSRYLLTADMPDPDLVIRTSGEQRLSNFLLWQTAYSEFVFIETLWPDFTKADLERALSEFHGRERRYGAIAGRR